MPTQSAYGATTLRAKLGQIGLLLLIIAAFSVFSAYMLQPFADHAGEAKPATDKPTFANQSSPGQDVLSVEWLEQQRAVHDTIPSRATAQDDVLSVEWLEQQRAAKASVHSPATTPDDVLSAEWLERNRQSTTNESRRGNRATQPVLDNYIGFIE